MQNKKLFFAMFLGVAIAVSGCATVQKKSVAKGGEEPEEFDLRLRGVEKTLEKYRIYSRSLTKTSEAGKNLKDKNEEADFEVELNTTEVDDVRGYMTQFAKTVKKTGEADLNSLGFPELNQTIEFRYDSKAEVLKAGDFPENSLFYVPPVSLPLEPVSVGDSWTLIRDWTSMNSKIPLRLELVSVLKDVKPCLKNDRCLDIEISGNVSVINLNAEEAKFESEVHGRIIFALYKGEMLWSLVTSDEKFVTSKSEMGSRSCVLTSLETPIDSKWVGRRDKSCDPKTATGKLLGFMD